MLRTPLLAAARSPRLRRYTETSRLTRPVVGRFVAGTTRTDALRTATDLVDGGRLVTVDLLGEDTRSAEQADRTVRAYRSLLAAVGDAGFGDRVEVSVKLSALGQSLADGHRVSVANARSICAAAADADTTVTLDMEDHTTTDATLAALAELRADFPRTGAVLQAYLRRTEGDCRDLAVAGSRVRLCKGAYAEPPSVAYRGAEVAESYRRCLAVLMAGPGYPMIATHDPAMIAVARSLVATHGRAPSSYEFQMLLGVRPDAQRHIAAAGHRMRVYVPYGDDWYGYFVRRLAERPANLAFFLRSLVSTR
ncbi:MAG TPA: proline dehydrogenase family protein [Pseudonocardiaceae bacterium]|nr:proline dehydrogenase family protein [Pseudonocardiaceae bacterium]